MCGIAGIVRSDRQALDVSIFHSLGQALAHRGPDDRGFLSWSETAAVRVARDPQAVSGGWVGLVHRRLSIVDLSSSGWQPMGTPDGRWYIVFNGEIYNYLELRAELQAAGYTFRSHSDTEVLLAAYAHWGSQALQRLVGMFACGILDTQARTLFLARDFFGIKPLYYTYWQHGFAFASEIKALLTLPGVRRKVHPQRLYEYLRFGLTGHGQATLFADIRQLPPAHYLALPLDCPRAAQAVRYWHLALDQHCHLPLAAAAARLRELFLDSVRLHLRSDVPVGAALSGGIDSSALVMAMRHLQGPALQLHTFSYIADAALSEETWVDLVARTATAQVHKVQPKPADLMDDIAALVDLQDEPFSSTSIYAQMRVFRLAREAGVKVVLDGQGADELLGGYRAHLAARLASLLRQRHWVEAGRLLHRIGRLPGTAGLPLLARALGLLALSGPYEVPARWWRRYLYPEWLNAAWFADHGVVPAPIWRARERYLLREHLAQALMDNSLPMLLRYEDRNAMAFAVENRTPFLTPELVQFIFSLPEEYIIAPDGTSKAVFRHAMRGLVPDPVLERRDKIGFATPERDWLAALGPWADKLLRSDTARHIPALNLPAIERQWQALLTGQRAFDFRAWRWLNCICWAERFQVRFAA